MFQLFIEQYAFIFIAAIITIGLLIMLRSFITLGVQVVLVAGIVMLSELNVSPVFYIAQAALSGLVIYKIIKALDMNYRLVLEKTHKLTPNLIKKEHRGSRFSFWNTK